MAHKHSSTEAARRPNAGAAFDAQATKRKRGRPGDLQPDELDEATLATVRKVVDLAWSGHRPLTVEKPDLDGLSLSELCDVLAELGGAPAYEDEDD